MLPVRHPLQCFFAANVAPFVQTPVFALQSRFDSWQIENELAANRSEVDPINSFGDLLASM